MENNMEILSPGYEGIIWNLDKFGTLTVTGKGKIPDCACGKSRTLRGRKPVPADPRGKGDPLHYICR